MSRPLRLLITAGPTREPIDEVRFISNRSSGQVGVALAEAAVEAGHEVTLLLGPVMVAAAMHERCRVERFTTCEDLRRLLGTHFAPERCDVLVMAAAVSDYRPLKPQAGKLPRQADGRVFLELEPTPDLVAEAAGRKTPQQKIIAFALEEPAQLEARAAEKMRRKNVDAIVANPLATMDAGHIEPVLLTASGERHSPGLVSKPIFADWLIRRLPRL